MKNKQLESAIKSYEDLETGIDINNIKQIYKGIYEINNHIIDTNKNSITPTIKYDL